MIANISCSTCIQKIGCAWCIPNNLTNENVAKCLTEDSPCDGGKKVSPIGEAKGPGNNASLEEEYNLALTTSISSLKLRVGEPQKVEMTLKVSLDGLLDLYYLTDLSTSMADDMKQLQIHGEKLIDALEQETNNFRIGFGTFIDKKIMPYFDPYDQTTAEPKDPCQNTYSFCNSMNLTEDGKVLFQSTVGSVSVGDNKDAPEGGLDALMQVLVCEDAIGWRKSALRIVLYASESAFHFAGDGKLAGIDKINDGLCHLDSEGKYYTEGLTQDYPSVAQIARAAKDNNIHVIFAVTKDVFELHRILANHVSGSEVTELAEDSSNIIDIVTEEFEKISRTLELKSEASDEVKVSFKYACPIGYPSKCEGLKMGQDYKVTAEVTLLRCPADNVNSKLVLSAVGLNANVPIDLEYICSCDCEQDENIEANSPQCSNKGSLKCGQCACPAGVYGTTCACTEMEYGNDTACIMQGQSTSCSGQGQCICQKCECDEDYYGDHCECADRGCPLDFGRECNAHGICVCMKCECDDGWDGDSCSCSTAKTQCIVSTESESEELCSGQGVCECNSCKCNQTGQGDDEYFGKYCQDCPTCGGECSNLKTCVLCHLYVLKDKVDSGVNETTCAAKRDQECAQANITLVADESMLNTTTYSECSIQVDDCTRYFFYRRRTDEIQMVLVGDWDCPLKWWEILLAVVVPMVAIGLLTLTIWYLVHLHVRKQEMLNFKKNEDAAWLNSPHENVLYRDPVSQTQNPLFGKAM